MGITPVNSNLRLDVLVGELRQLLSPSAVFTSGMRVYLPDASESDGSKTVKCNLIAEGEEVLQTPTRWLRRWDRGRSTSEHDIHAHIDQAERSEFQHLDSILQQIFEHPR